VPSRQCPHDLKLVGFDVDGVFTDGSFHLSNDGVESKSFNTQDGFGIRCLLNAGIEVAVISGRSSKAVSIRMRELGVKYVFQGSTDKVAAFDSVVADLGISEKQTAFVGDDVPDLPLLQHVAFSIAVANATPEVKQQCDWTTAASGGAGAVREVCERVLAQTKNESS